MATLEVNTMGYKLELIRPDDNDAYDVKAGRKNAACEDGSENVAYRDTLPKIHATALDELKVLFGGAEREVNQKATDAAKARSDKPESVKDVLETIPKYVRRNTANFSEEQREKVRAILQSAADKNPIDPAPSARQAKIPAEYLAKADTVLDLEEDAREAKITDWLNKVTQGGGSYEIDRDENGAPTRTSLARLVGEIVKVSL